ncbi:MAG: tRNA 2-thiocytidine(32) synthetase TtcA [Deltaproteobacteria bacterium]|nr:tRNA 2-thiocytidine(32) synthetase TtcA [Deltaproteobacteria bacterium]
MSYNTRRYFEKRIRKKVGSALHDYSMITSQDKVMVAISGGKDSIVLLQVLCDLRKAAPVQFDIIPVHIRTGFEKDFEKVAIWIQNELHLEVMQIDSHISNILQKVSDPEKSTCALCSRLRRGVLYGLAPRLSASSIALGHHMDDIIETFLLRCFFTGQIGAMAPSRVSNDGKNRVIRPMAYCTNDLVENYFHYLDIEPVETLCPLRNDSKRELVRAYLSEFERQIPTVKYSIFAALGNIDTKSMCLKEGIYAYHD